MVVLSLSVSVFSTVVLEQLCSYTEKCLELDFVRLGRVERNFYVIMNVLFTVPFDILHNI